jgi:hypothetical protein
MSCLVVCDMGYVVWCGVLLGKMNLEEVSFILNTSGIPYSKYEVGTHMHYHMNTCDIGDVNGCA